MKKDRWSPYLVGALIGVLSWFTFLISNKHVGTTTTFVKATALLESVVSPDHVAHSSYFKKYLVGKPFFDWQMVFVIFIFLGSLLASKMSKSKHVEHVPRLWEKNFGPSRLKRNLGALIGGFLLVFGARLAGGCTSGHAIGGGMQLALSGWIFIVALFSTGILTAKLIYRRG